MNPYDILGRWLSLFGMWSWQDDWRCACEIVPTVGREGIGGMPVFVGC